MSEKTETTKLWRVQVKYDVLVIADDEEEAEYEAKYAIWYKDVMEDCINTHEVITRRDIPKGWRSAIPFGGSDNRTCREIADQNQNTK